MPIHVSEFRTADFLNADIPDRFDAIVANPPYVRHHEAKISETVWQRFDRQFDVRLDRRTNIYALFLLKIMSLLSPRGRAAVITPSEFLNADFGVKVKRLLLANRAYRGFIAFDHAVNVFDGVLTTACISVFDAAAKDDRVTMVRIANGDRLAEAFACFDAEAGESQSAAMNVAHRAVQH